MISLPSHTRLRVRDDSYFGLQTKSDLSIALEEYGLPHVLANVVPRLDLDDSATARALDEVLSVRRQTEGSSHYSFNRVFNSVLRDTMAEHDCDHYEALEMLASGDFSPAVDIVIHYTLYACDDEIETLQELIRRRARSLIDEDERELVAA